MPDPLTDLIGGPAVFVLVLARSSGLVWGLAWLGGAAGAGMRAKAAAAALIAAAVAPMVGDGVAAPEDPLALGGSALAEAAVGAALGLGAGLIAASARLAGELIGAQAGLSAASTLAPDSAEGVETPLATLGGLIALAAFVALDGPLRLTLALADSYGLGEGGGGWSVGPGREAIRSAFEAVGHALGLALRLAAPVALSLLVAQFAVGVLVRGAPALSSFTTWLPVRLAVGLAMLLLGIAGLASGIAAAWSSALPGG